MEKPRVDKKKRLVCVHHDSLGMFEVYKINKKGKINKRIAPEFAFADDVDAAFRKMSYPRAGFRTVAGMQNASASSWIEYVELIWREANAKV